MKQVEVILRGTADVRQRQIIEVPDDAPDGDIRRIAIENAADNVWEYMGVNEDTIEVDFERQEAQPVYVVEWDRQYWGGDYNGSGDLLDVQPDPGESVERAFTRIHGYNYAHIVHYSVKEEH